MRYPAFVAEMGQPANRPKLYFGVWSGFAIVIGFTVGRRRIYSKLGLGSQGQFLDVGYGCFPVLDDALLRQVSSLGGCLWRRAEISTPKAKKIQKTTLHIYCFLLSWVA